MLRKFSSNAYEIELPSNLGISPIFNALDLYPFKETIDYFTDAPDNDNIQTIDWEKQLPIAQQKQIESILDQKVVKKTRGKEYI